MTDTATTKEKLSSIRLPKLRRSERTAAISSVLSLILGVGLLIYSLHYRTAIGAIGGIMAISRSVMGFLLVVGIRASRLRTKTYTEGLYKLENIFAVIIGVVILVLTYEVAKVSITHIGKHYVFTSSPGYALPFFAGFAVFTAVVAFYKRRVATQENCPSLLADSWFSFADAIALLVIGIALFADVMGYDRLYAFAGIIVSVFVAVIGCYIIVGGLKVLLDASVSRDVLDQVQKIASSNPEVKKVIRVEGRNSGSFILLHVILEPMAYDLEEAAQVSRQIEDSIKGGVEYVDEVVVEFGSEADETVGAVAVGSDGHTVSSSLLSADSLALVDQDADPSDTSSVLVPNPALKVTSGKSENLAVFLGRRAVDILYVTEPLSDEALSLSLEAYGIEVVPRGDIADVADIITDLSTRSSRKVSAPTPEAQGSGAS
jgi:divalent metal cation (Fe/Co/Zn/Cd) transporter